LAQQHIAEALQTVENEEKPEQTDDESLNEQDLIDVRIQNSPVRTLPTQEFGKT
jgi:hypothetical protein